MDEEDLKARTQDFGVRIVKLVSALPPGRNGDILGRQLLRSGTSVGANYRSACRGRSKAEFVSKMNIALEEADESVYWLELLIKAEIISQDRLSGLLQEANELVRILHASVKTARNHS